MKKDNLTGMGKTKTRVFGVPGVIGSVKTQNDYNNVLHKVGMGKYMRKKTKSKTSKAKMMAGGSFWGDVGDVIKSGAQAGASALASYGVPLLLAGLGKDKNMNRPSPIITNQTMSQMPSSMDAMDVMEVSTPVRTTVYKPPEIVPMSADIYQPVSLAPPTVASIKPTLSVPQVSSQSVANAKEQGEKVYKTMPITAADLNKGRASQQKMLKDNPQFKRNPQNRTVLGHALQLAHKLIKDNKLISRGLKYVKYDRAAQLAESLGYGKKAKPKTVKPKMRKVKKTK